MNLSKHKTCQYKSTHACISFPAQRSVGMNPHQLALFLGFYFYLLNANAANDSQRIILLASLVQIRALQAQLLLWNQRQRRRHRVPCFWVFPQPQQSWFDIHYFDATIPGEYFRRQLWLNRNTFSLLLNIRPRLARQNTHFESKKTQVLQN